MINPVGLDPRFAGVAPPSIDTSRHVPTNGFLSSACDFICPACPRPVPRRMSSPRPTTTPTLLLIETSLHALSKVDGERRLLRAATVTQEAQYPSARPPSTSSAPESGTSTGLGV